jgi:PAS domain S-box-containing protein
LIRRLRLVAQVFAHAMSRRRAERAMQETERKLRTLLANLPGLAYRCANVPDWAFEFVSEGALPLTGYTPREITVGGTVSYGSLIHPDDRQIVWDTVQEAVHRDASFDLEYRIRTKDGKERWVFERGRAVPSPHGQSPVLEGFVMDITERRRAEAALRESESRFRDLADLLPQTVFETDARGFFTFANRSGLKQFRYAEHEVSSVSVPQVVAPGDRERAVQNLQQKLTGRPTASNEYMAIRKDGSTFPALLYSSPILRDGSPAGLRGILIDITERYRAEMALRESEKKYRDLYEGSRDGFAEVDDKMRLVECNSVFLEMIGYSKEEILGRTLQEITPSRWHGEEKRISREQIHARGYSDVYEKEYVRKDGSVFPAEVRAYAIRDTAGRHCGVWAVVRDITARKHAETALRASEQNYREIFNAVNDAILIQDPDTGAVLDVNRTVLDVYGYTYEEAMHLKLGETGVPGPSRAAQEAMARVRRVAHEGPQLFEWLSRKKNGDPIWEEVNLRIASIGGKRRVLAVIRDITDRKKAEIQAQQHLAELTRAWHANMLGEMASGLAHELNQPLCAVVNYSNGCLRLIRKEGYAIETVRNSIEQIAAQAQRAADIIKRIRALVAKRDPQRTRIDLSGIINGAVQMLREEADKHNVAIVSKGQEKRPAVKGDGVEIEQVVLNLMRNAIEAMNDPLVSRRVLTISNQVRDGRMIEIAVADTGRGIPPELSEKIFDSFFTTKAEGLGIGLSLSRRIVESHGGRLWAESDGRSGATFRFTLPVEGGTHGEG